MSEIQTHVMNAEVSAHSDTQYGTGYAQGVGFKGVKGFWKLTPDLQAEMDNGGIQWPPPKERVVRVELRAKPYTKKNGDPGFYTDILKYHPKAAGDAESWDYGAGTPAAGKAPQQRQRNDADTNLSIARQVVVKAEAEVLARALMLSEASEVGVPALVAGLYPDWRRHCAELWGDPVPAQQPAPLVIGVDTDDTGGLGGDEIPFAPSML